MELNNQNTSAVAVAQPTDIAPVPPTPQKSGIAKKVITAVLACAVVAGGIFAARTYLKPDPEKIVKAAAAATYSQQREFENKVYSEIPAAKMMLSGESMPDSESSFSLALKSAGGFDYAEMISAVLSGTTVSGNSAVSQTDKLADIDIALSHRDTHIIGADIFISPELAAVSVPELSSKMLSVIPSSLAQDYKNSIFFDPNGISDGDLKLIQESLTSVFDNSGLTAADTEKIESDIIAIMAKAAANAQYSRSEPSGLYTVMLPGADVKNAIIELSRYIYADSKLAPVIKRSFEPVIMTDKQYASYDEALNGMFARLEAELPELPTAIELDIDKTVIRKAKITVTPTANSDSSSSDIITELEFSPTSCLAQVSMTVYEGESQTSVLSTARSSLEDGVYSSSFIIDVFSDEASISVPFSLTLSKQGSLDCSLSMDVSAGEEAVTAAISVNGTAVTENGVLKYDIPACTADITADSQNYYAEFSLNGSLGPITALPAAPAEHIPVFSMTEDDVDSLSDDIREGARPIIGKLYNIVIGK